MNAATVKLTFQAQTTNILSNFPSNSESYVKAIGWQFIIDSKEGAYLQTKESFFMNNGISIAIDSKNS